MCKNSQKIVKISKKNNAMIIQIVQQAFQAWMSSSITMLNTTYIKKHMKIHTVQFGRSIL